MSEPTVEQLLKRLERRRNVMDRQEVSLAAKTRRIDKLRAQNEELEKKLEHEKKVNEGLKNEVITNLLKTKNQIIRYEIRYYSKKNWNE